MVDGAVAAVVQQEVDGSARITATDGVNLAWITAPEDRSEAAAFLAAVMRLPLAEPGVIEPLRPARQRGRHHGCPGIRRVEVELFETRMLLGLLRSHPRRRRRRDTT